MSISTLQWGNTTLVFDHPAFQEGCINGRRYYFEDDCQEEQKNRETKRLLLASSLLEVIARLDEANHYQLDDGCDITTFRNGVEELLGVLVGYLSGPLHPETEVERTARYAEYVLIQKQ